MAYNNMTGYLFNHIEGILRYKNHGGDEGGTAIGIGAHDFLISRKILRKCGVSISDADVERHKSTLLRPEFAQSSKRMSGLFFKHYGYSSYVDLDIYDRADIVFDLCKPIPETLHQKFDLVFDPTSNYVVNINQSYANTSRMLKVGGMKIVMGVLGDQTNRFDLNPSPNYLIDFHVNNGFRVERAFLLDRRGRIFPYKRYQTKVTPLDALLPLPLVLTWMIKTFLYSVLYMRRSVRSASHTNYGDAGFVAPSLSVPANHQVRSRIKTFVKGALSKDRLDYIRSGLNRISWMNQAFASLISPTWIVAIVLEKAEESVHGEFHVTAHYRNVGQAI